VEGQAEPAPGSEPTADLRGIFNPAYFEAIGIPLVRGRNFTAEELDQKKPVVIVNQSLARKLWPAGDAIGQHLRSLPSKSSPTPIVSTVIGIAGDTHQLSIEEGTRPEVTKPMADYTQLTLALRSSENPEAMIERVKNQVWSVDRYLPVFEVQTMRQVVDQSTSQRRFQSFLMLIFAALALVLASVGIYGVLSSLVVQRTQEIGVRMALGAQTRDILRLIVKQGMTPVTFGLAIGLAAALALGRLLTSQLFQVSATNPILLGGTIAILALAALLACLFPARRASLVNPIEALRAE
jgi:putative ABC transport system permease protein